MQKHFLFVDTYFSFHTYKQYRKSLNEPVKTLFITWNKELFKIAQLHSAFEEVHMAQDLPRGLRSYSFKKRKEFEGFIENHVTSEPWDAFFTHQINDIKTNFASQVFKKYHPESKMRLLPDGTMNLLTRPLKNKNHRSQKMKKRTGAVFGLPYEPYNGDWTGLGSRFFSKMLLPQNFPHSYDEGNVQRFKLDHLGVAKNETPRLLFLDQNFIEMGYFDEDSYKKLMEFLRNHFQKLGVNSFLFKKHPKNLTDLKFKGWANYSSDKLLDDEILAGEFTHVVAINSSALMNVAFDKDSSVRYFTVNAQPILKKGQSLFDSYLQKLKLMGCEEISLL